LSLINRIYERPEALRISLIMSKVQTIGSAVVHGTIVDIKKCR
jgi:hypothetical protein